MKTATLFSFREFKRGEPPQMRCAQLLGEGGFSTTFRRVQIFHASEIFVAPDRFFKNGLVRCSSLSPRRVSPLVTSM